MSHKSRAQELRRIPPWADLDKIAAFYAACPHGKIVDHYYPLQGKTVCGLHVLENLQYLTPRENLAKGAKHPQMNDQIAEDRIVGIGPIRLICDGRLYTITANHHQRKVCAKHPVLEGWRRRKNGACLACARGHVLKHVRVMGIARSDSAISKGAKHPGNP